MKFKLTDDYEYWWPVTVVQPDPDPKRAGKTVQSSFEVRFKALPRDRAKEIDAALRTADQAEHGAFTDRLLAEVVQDWRYVEDEDGELITFSAGMLDRMLQFPWNRDALFAAYAESIQGIRRKN